MRTALAILALVGATVPAISQTQIVSGHEADWLLTTYAKLAFLTSFHEPVQAAMAATHGHNVNEVELAKKTEDSHLEITLSDIKVGQLTDIFGQKWFDQADFPVAPREILEVQVGTSNYSDIDAGNSVSWKTATAKWVVADPAPPSDLMAVAKSWSVERGLSLEMDRLKDGVTYTRYATYTVTLHFQGKSNTYKAMFLFGKDANGGERGLCEDAYLQSNIFMMGGSLNSMDLLPTGLLRTRLRDYPPLREWLRAHAVTGQNCHTGAGEFCCVDNRCGITTVDLDRELSQPVKSRRKP